MLYERRRDIGLTVLRGRVSKCVIYGYMFGVGSNSRETDVSISERLVSDLQSHKTLISDTSVKYP